MIIRNGLRYRFEISLSVSVGFIVNWSTESVVQVLDVKLSGRLLFPVVNQKGMRLLATNSPSMHYNFRTFEFKKKMKYSHAAVNCGSPTFARRLIKT